jgi:hypothetical protein
VQRLNALVEYTACGIPVAQTITAVPRTWTPLLPLENSLAPKGSPEIDKRRPSLFPLFAAMQFPEPH